MDLTYSTLGTPRRAQTPLTNVEMAREQDAGLSPSGETPAL